MTNFAKEIKEHMPVVGTDGTEFAQVDCLQGENMIKLTRDENGNHHWIPISWVTDVSSVVQLDRSVMQVQEEWSTSNPEDL
jgi:hypothetical protein